MAVSLSLKNADPLPVDGVWEEYCWTAEDGQKLCLEWWIDACVGKICENQHVTGPTTIAGGQRSPAVPGEPELYCFMIANGDVLCYEVVVEACRVATCSPGDDFEPLTVVSVPLPTSADEGEWYCWTHENGNDYCMMVTIDSCTGFICHDEHARDELAIGLAPVGDGVGMSCQSAECLFQFVDWCLGSGGSPTTTGHEPDGCASGR